MKRTTTALVACAIIATIGSCSKGTTTKPTTPAVAGKFATLYLHIDTATLWNIASNQKTGSTAKITLSGDMTITGFSTYAGGSYRIELTDSSSVLN